MFGLPVKSVAIPSPKKILATTVKLVARVAKKVADHSRIQKLHDELSIKGGAILKMQITTLSRTTPCNVTKINFPIWNGGKRVVGIAPHRIGTHNQIEILYTRKSDGERIYPNPFYMSGADIKRYPLEPLEKHPNIYLYLIPVDDLTLLERE